MKIKKLIIGLTIFSTVSFVIVAGLEVYFKTEHIKRQKATEQALGGSTGNMVKSDVSGLVFEFAPNQWENNSQGYRDYEYSFYKHPDIFRIVVIGDSIAEGHGISLDESFPKVLEKQLNEANLGMKFEVVNLSRSMYQTGQHLVQLDTEVFQYDPDLLIWSHVPNDVQITLYHDRSLEEFDIIDYFHEPQSYLLDFIDYKLFFLREKYLAAVNGCDEVLWSQYLNCVYWDDVTGDIERIANTVNDEELDTFFVVHPSLEASMNDPNLYTLEQYHRDMGSLLTENGLEYLDVLPLYRHYQLDELLLPMLPGNPYPDVVHPNAFGHQLIADELFQVVMQKVSNPEDSN
ncbi:MAG: SGNH/GDSL hydrolase family protein [Candidatus Dojkabacteria bacterium]